MSQTRRIEFIDLAKGVCILLVVLRHVGINIPIFDFLRMPLYFILSGLFFKTYGGGKNFILKKINKILIPFLFFYIISYIAYYIIHYTLPELPLEDYNGLQDLFVQHTLFNAPIWFLLCLFWVNVLFCIITMAANNEILRFFFVIALCAIGFVLHIIEVFVPLCLDSSLIALPFFYIGFHLKKTYLLYDSSKMWIDVLIIITGLLVIISTAFFPIKVDIHHNSIDIYAYLMSSYGVITLLLVCKYIKYIPIISYIGRYSIIVLCVHHLIQRPTKVVVGYFVNIDGISNIISFIIVITLSTLLISPCIKYIPYFVAQKDLLNKNI